MDEIKEGMQLVSELEVAGLLSLKPETLQIWRIKKIGPKYVKISANCVRYRLADVQDWIVSKVQDTNLLEAA